MSQPKYKSVKVLQRKIDAYFKECDEKGDPYTIPGLAYFLGFARKNALWDLENREKKKVRPTRKDKEIADVVKRARLRIENQRLTQMIRNKINVAGAIFSLTNNFGYKNQQYSENKNEISIKLEINDITKEKKANKRAKKNKDG